MPGNVFNLEGQHPEDVLDHGFKFSGFGTGDNVSTFTVTVGSGMTQPISASASGQTVTVWLQGTTVGRHRVIVDAVSVAGREARIEADIVISDPA